ncbi:MAG: DUF6883 domain-containing protein [Acetobacteraceae bacterium]
MSGGTLPNSGQAMVADAKARDFLLQASHPDNKGRAQFLASFGFVPELWISLREALSEHPVRNQVVRVEATSFGTKYTVQCALVSPDRRNPCVSTLWIINNGERVPSFVTMLPRPIGGPRPGTRGPAA